jgi:predicted AlkP superfamily phosphohydrolase/phosphomutase
MGKYHIMKKVILIGIDGATPELIEKWINEGFLQNFKKIMNGGSYGHLKSTINMTFFMI